MYDDNEILFQLPETVKPNLMLPDPDLLSIYEDRQNRTLWMLKEVGDESYDWVDFIIRCNREDRTLPPEQRKPIKCIIANYGGSLEEAKMLVEMIHLSKTPVWGIVIGMCASAASMIFLACHKRFATRNATIIIHKGSCENIGGSYAEVQQFMENYKKDIEALSTFYKEYTHIAPEEVDQRLNEGDWYIYVDEGVEKGLIDEIVTSIDIFCK